MFVKLLQNEWGEKCQKKKNYTNCLARIQKWTLNRHVDVREFIQLNYSLYEGDEQFLEGPTEATTKLWIK